MRKFLSGMALAICLFGVTSPVQADLQGSLLNEYNASAKGNTYAVTDSNVGKIDEVLASPKINILCLQVAYANYDKSLTPKLMEWVRKGGSLWFYDARLADQFGMEMYELRADQFRGKPEKGDVGNVKMKGMAVTVMPIQNHAVGTGVASVAVFLPQLDDKGSVYGSIVPSIGVDNLLQFAADSPAISALRREGYGTVVFKPLLWEKTLSGERFQRNLIDYCAGFGVPGMGGEGRVGEVLADKKNYVADTTSAAIPGEGTYAASLPENNGAETSVAPKTMEDSINAARAIYNGQGRASASANTEVAAPIVDNHDVMIVAGEKEPRTGKIVTEEIIFEGGSESLCLHPEELRRLEIGQYGNLDSVEMKNGRTIKGFLMNTTIGIQTEHGVYNCKKNDLKTIEFATIQE